jgi:hypothetical protein
VYPEDRVLVGVIRRKRDLEKAQREHWYRVPQGQATKGIHAEYVAFFLSRAFKEQNGGIRFYARRTGTELVSRRDLLPEEANHPHADNLYYKLQFGELRRKDPPILNLPHRRFAFIYTTWDRFCAASVITDLYSDADYFVDRVFHALEKTGVRAERIWEAARMSEDGGAQIRVLCEEGTVIASTTPRGEHVVPLPVGDSPQMVQNSVEAILEAIRRHGGLMMVPVPVED